MSLRTGILLWFAAVPALAGDSKPLFDGTTFAGWNGDTTKVWRIEDGALVAGSRGQAAARNEFLVTDAEFENFELRLQYRLECVQNCNAGVQFRSQRVPNHHEVSGYQADIAAGIDGALYDESRRNKMLAPIPPRDLQERSLATARDGWHDYVIRCEGPRIRITLNGVPMTDYVEPDADIPRRGRIGLQIHGGMVGIVRYRSIQLEQLPATPAGENPKASPAPRVAASTLRFGQPSAAEGPLPPFEGGRFRIDGGEMIVCVGQTDMVRAARDGTLESILMLHAADLSPRMRSMAWEADTVFGQWRDIAFGNWRDQLTAAGATLVIAQFGQAEIVNRPDAAEPRRIAEFVAAYEKLLDEVAAVTKRVVLISPHPFEKPESSHMPDLSDRNAAVAAYARAIADLASRRQAAFVDLATLAAPAGTRLTDNGIHLTREGQRAAALAIASGLFIPTADDGMIATVRRAVVEKNRLWFDAWRPMNWAFAFGDRTEQPFSTGNPPLRLELEGFRPLVAAADGRVHAVAAAARAGRPAPPADGAAPPASPAAPQEHHSPEAERAAFTVADGYDVNLFASEADGVVKPLQMRFDDRGRLWVICSPTYPHIEPGRKPADFILVCEDADGDGRADRFTRFAEGLFIPMGIEFGDGGVYVCEATELVHLRDEDGDGKADGRRVLLSGFGTADSHQMINGLERGLGGELFFTQGHHAYSHVETPWGVALLHRAGVWRYRPRTGRLAGFFNESSAGLNCQGVTADDFGQVIHNSGAHSGGFYTVPGMIPTTKPRGYPAMVAPDRRSSGVEIIGTAHLPEAMQGCLVWGGFMANNVQVHRIRDDGSGLKAEVMPDLMRSSRREFRPVNVRVGPDGGIYVCDWYNAVIGHYQAGYRSPERDHARGRIWRVTATGRPLVKPTPLADLSPRQVLEQLRSPERLVRHHAMGKLQEQRTDTVVGELDAWVAGIPTADPLRSRLLVHAAGVYEAHELWRPDLVRHLLACDDPRARAYAARVVGHRAESLPAVAAGDELARANAECLEWLSRCAADDHPRVRLESIVASAWVNDPRAIEVAAAAMDGFRDRYLDHAFAQAVDALRPRWRGALAQGQLQFGGSGQRLRAVLAADGTPDAVPAITALANDLNLTAADRVRLLELLADIGGPAEMARIADEAVAFIGDNAGRGSLPVDSSLRLLDCLARVTRSRGMAPQGDVTKLVLPLLESEDTAVVERGLRLAGLWQAKPLASNVRSLLSGKGHPPAVVAAAIEAIGRLEGKPAVATIEPFAEASQPDVVRLAALRAIMPIDVGRAAVLVAEAIPRAEHEKAMAELLVPLISTKGGSTALEAAVAGAGVPPDAAKLSLRVLAGAGVNDPGLIGSLQRIAGVGTERPAYDEGFVKALAAEAMTAGDAARGREVFRSKMANCTGCHRVGTEGGAIGPELTIVGAGRSPELLVESVLWPNRQIREGYIAKRILTDDGRLLTGYVRSESSERVELFETAANATMLIPREAIEEMADAGSVMPEGLTSGMTRAETRDLVRYLVELRTP